MKRTPNKTDVINCLEDLRSKMTMASITMRLALPKERYEHADELEGAADIVQTWIEGIREEIWH